MQSKAYLLDDQILLALVYACCDCMAFASGYKCRGFCNIRDMCRWNTPLDEEDVAPEEHRATWGQGEPPPLPPAAASRKRPLEDDEELDDDVKRRLASLQGGGVD